MPVRGIRGATTAKDNIEEEIVSATEELLSEILKRNELKIEDISSVIFTATRDLNAQFPALAARRLGWNNTPLMCATEIDVPKGLKRCIRVLLQVNSDKDQREMNHVYLRDAVNLRREE